MISTIKMIMMYSGLWGSANSQRQDELQLSKLCPFTYWPLSHSSVSAPPFASSSVFITLRIWIFVICSTPLLLMAFQLNEYGEKWHANGFGLWVWVCVCVCVCVCVFVEREGVKVREPQEEKNAGQIICMRVEIQLMGAELQALLCVVPQWRRVVVYRNYRMTYLFASDTGLKIPECCNPFFFK